jgi:glutamate racemase
MQSRHPIGIFDSGYGGLTVFKCIKEALPMFDYIYLGDNARAPYGNRSFDTVHEYTLQCVKWFFEQGCPLVILACNTASAKALRTIQQSDLPTLDPDKRVLGVIRPTAEVIGNYTNTGHIGILGTKGTVASDSYQLEIHKFSPDVEVHQLACPIWVPLIENGLYDSEGADFFIKRDLDILLAPNPLIDTILLACTHYPILLEKIKKHVPPGIRIVTQGEIVARSLADYLDRHPEMVKRITKGASTQVFTTDDPSDFDAHASLFFGEPVQSTRVHQL